MHHWRITLLLLLLGAGTVALVPAWADDDTSGDSDSGSDDSGEDDSDDNDSGKDGTGGGSSRTDDDEDHSGKDDIKEVEDQRRASDAVKNGDAATLKEILAKVRKKYRGDVVRVSLRGSGRNLTYRIKLLNENSRLIEVQVNAVSRRIMRVKGQ